MGGGVTGWYKGFQVQTLGLDGLNAYGYAYMSLVYEFIMHACRLHFVMIMIFMYELTCLCRLYHVNMDLFFPTR